MTTSSEDGSRKRIEFPQEILDEIILRTDHDKDLHRWREVSRSCASAALRPLYSEMTFFCDCYGPSPIASDSEIRGLTAIGESSTIMRTIKTIRIIHSADAILGGSRGMVDEPAVHPDLATENFALQPPRNIADPRHLATFLQSPLLEIESLIIRGPIYLSKPVLRRTIYWHTGLGIVQDAVATLAKQSSRKLKTLALNCVQGFDMSIFAYLPELEYLSITGCSRPMHREATTTPPPICQEVSGYDPKVRWGILTLICPASQDQSFCNIFPGF